MHIGEGGYGVFNSEHLVYLPFVLNMKNSYHQCWMIAFAKYACIYLIRNIFNDLHSR